MKIAIDISQIVYGTGVSTYTRNLVERLVVLYPKDHFILFGGSLRSQKILHSFLKGHDNVSHVIMPIPPKITGLLWNSFHLFSPDKFLANPDIIHTSDWAEPPSKYPKVTTVHDLIPFIFPQTTTSSIRSTHRKRLAWVNKESDAIISVSDSTKSDLESVLRIKQERITVVPEGVDGFFKPQPPFIIDTILRKYSITGDYIFSLSTLEPRKNQVKLIKAFKKLKTKFPQLKLVIAGKTGWGEGIQPTTDVKLLGFVPDADLPALFSGSLAYVLVSLYEGFSLTHLEAMACGTAVVGSNVSSMPEVIGRAGVLVDPNSIEDIAQGIEKALESRDEYIEKGLKRASLYSWEEAAKLTHAVYEKVLKSI